MKSLASRTWLPLWLSTAEWWIQLSDWMTPMCTYSSLYVYCVFFLWVCDRTRLKMKDAIPSQWLVCYCMRVYLCLFLWVCLVCVTLPWEKMMDVYDRCLVGDGWLVFHWYRRSRQRKYQWLAVAKIILLGYISVQLRWQCEWRHGKKF